MGWWHAVGVWFWEHRETLASIQSFTTVLATLGGALVGLTWLRRHRAQKLAEQRLSAALEVLALFDDSVFALRRYAHSGHPALLEGVREISASLVKAERILNLLFEDPTRDVYRVMNSRLGGSLDTIPRIESPEQRSAAMTAVLEDTKGPRQLLILYLKRDLGRSMTGEDKLNRPPLEERTRELGQRLDAERLAKSTQGVRNVDKSED